MHVARAGRGGWGFPETKPSPPPGGASSRTWRGSRPPNCPKTATTSSAAAGHAHTTEKNGVEFLGEIPIIQSIMDGADAGTPAAGIDFRVEEHYRGIAEKIVGKVMKNG